MVRMMKNVLSDKWDSQEKSPSLDIPALRKELSRDGLFSQLPPQSDFLYNSIEALHHAKLYRAILDQAVIDCLSPTEEIRTEAYLFFFCPDGSPSDDLKFICQSAFLDVGYAQKHVIKVLDLLCPKEYSK